ncbi:hypothetical protein NIES4102_01150 [Chondrocystis sp. NIES-4102]|nr:hypothetical protein NIES4102_01150 [Chondrocystis sp. NIES-4102]
MTNSHKKVFIEPELFVHGGIEEITEQNNAIAYTDVPQGTAADPTLPGMGILGS